MATFFKVTRDQILLESICFSPSIVMQTELFNLEITTNLGLEKHLNSNLLNSAKIWLLNL